jgi:hypothetical protein
MHTVETKQGKAKHTVIFYDSDKVLPYRRYQKFNKHMMIDLEVGSSIQDYDKRMSRAISYLNADDAKSAGVELTNQRQCVHNSLEGYSPKGMALAVMVHSIDGVKYDDYEEATLNEILDKFDSIGFTKLMLDETVDYLKKKIEEELRIYHASHFRGNLNYNVAKIKQLNARLDNILGQDSKEDKVSAENEMLRMSKPSLWNVHMEGNAELEMETGFEDFMFLVAEHTNEDLDKITVFRFYSLLDYIKSKNTNG